LLPKNESFAKQYARAFELRNEHWPEEMVKIADDSRNDWMTRTYGDTEVDVPNPEVTKRSQIRIETRKWLMGKSQPVGWVERSETHRLVAAAFQKGDGFHRASSV
jgi:hypothetical protein